MARRAKGRSTGRSTARRKEGSGKVPEDAPEAPGRWVTTSFVSTDLVRSNLVPELARAGGLVVKALGKDAPPAGAGALSSRVLHHVVMSGAGSDLAHLAIEDFVELVDYDPVRHVALVLGRRTAPQEGPLLWLLHRVFSAAQLCCVVPGVHGHEPQTLEASPRGSFEEAMAVARVLKGSGGGGVGGSGAGGGAGPMSGPAVAVLDRVGLVMVVPPTGDLEAAITSALRVDDGGKVPHARSH